MKNIIQVFIFITGLLLIQSCGVTNKIIYSQELDYKILNYTQDRSSGYFENTARRSCKGLDGKDYTIAPWTKLEIVEAGTYAGEPVLVVKKAFISDKDCMKSVLPCHVKVFYPY